MATDTDLCNLSLLKLGGAGDQTTGVGLITDINGTDKISKQCKTLLPECRKRAISDLANIDCPFRETIKYADLGGEIADASLPEIGQYEYAFSIPADCLAMVAQINEDSLGNSVSPRIKYRYEIIANKNKNGRILLTNDLSNTDEDSAFIEYVIDIVNPAGFSQALKDCVVILLAAELWIVGKDEKLKQQLLIEYEQLVKPNAKRFNQSQGNNYEKPKPENYKGGRQ